MKNLIYIASILFTLSIVFLACSKSENQEDVYATDIDGNTYNTVKIGSQIWMAENLKVTKYRNGDPILQISDNNLWSNSQGVYCWYNNDVNNKDNYGALYNWQAVNDVRNLAPIGWHIATDEDWTTLVMYLGGAKVAGDKLKEKGSSHWINYLNTISPATNETNFTALPGGARGGNGLFFDLGSIGFWWTSTTVNSFDNAYYWILGSDYSGIDRSEMGKITGFSVRCVKD